MQKLLSIGADSKTVKGEAKGYRTAILYLAPASLSGRNLCPHSTPGCRASCLYTAGRGIQSNVQRARLKRTAFMLQKPVEFMAQLFEEITAHADACLSAGFIPVVRLNGTSDIPWENRKVMGKSLFDWFPLVHFYDYTKNPHRSRQSLVAGWPVNYRLVLSRSESNQADCERFLALGGNVAMVFDLSPADDMHPFWKVIPGEPDGTKKHHWPVIDGDKDDLRFLDPSPCIVGLRAKGKARHDQSGFVVR